MSLWFLASCFCRLYNNNSNNNFVELKSSHRQLHNNMPLPEDKTVVETGDSLVKTLRGAFGTPESYRPGQFPLSTQYVLDQCLIDSTAHAKGRLLRGTFHPTPKASSLSSAPHFTAESTPLLARFSSSTGLPVSPRRQPSNVRED